MKPVTEIHAPRLIWTIVALWATLAGSAAWVTHAAQNQRAPRRGSPRDRLQTGNQPLVGARLPAIDTMRIDPHRAGFKTRRLSRKDFESLQRQLAKRSSPRALDRSGRGPSPRNFTPPPAPPPYVDLTTNPRPPLVGASTRSHDLHPFWASDQLSIWIDSDRTDVDGLQTPPSNAKFHIWLLSSDGGATPVKITGAAFPDEVSGDQLFPAVNPARTRLAYAHRPGPSSPFQLFVLDISGATNPPARVQLTGLPGQPAPGRQLVNVSRPSWSADGNSIAFQAQRGNVTNDAFNVYTVDPDNPTSVRIVTRVPAGTALECIEPAWLPFSNAISFASTGTSLLADGTFDPATATPGSHTIWQVHPAGPSASRPFQQLTLGGPGIDDRQPAWNGGVNSRFSGALAFSSFGRRGSTYNIHWIASPGAEGPGVVVHELLTPDSDPLVAAVDPAKVNVSDEAFPSWSIGLAGVERIAHHTNRQANLSVSMTPPAPYPWDSTVRGGDRDVWVSDAQDLNPPTLVTFDEQAGEIVSIRDDFGRKLGTAGGTFTFKARVMDLGSGPSGVFFQIKDPDSASQDAGGLEHKLFGVNEFLARSNATQITHRIRTFVESDCDGIDVNSYSYYRASPRFDFVDDMSNFYGGAYDWYPVMVQVPSYLPGIDDAVGWTGSQHPPHPGWLEGKDDGVFPDEVRGDGIFTAQWRTPDVPSDFYVDVVAYDNAADPLNPGNTQNWIIYDNITGFSTEPLRNRFQALAVMDNALGQKWIRAGSTFLPSSRGFFRPFPSFRLGTESETLDKGPDQFPQQFIIPQPATPQCPVIGPVPIIDTTTDDLVAGGAARLLSFIGGPSAITVPQGQPAPLTLCAVLPGCVFCTPLPHYNYDVWRVLAKGPIPDSVFRDYTPRRERQPLDMSGTNFVDRLVPTRFILWHSPYTGDIWTGAGSIQDLNVQNQLRTFVNNGGRLIADGADIAWALTQDGINPDHPFLRDVLDARYLGDSDVARAELTVAATNSLADELVHDIFAGMYRNDGGTPPCPDFGMGVNEPSPLITPYSLPPFTTNQPGDLADAVPSTGLFFGTVPQISVLDGIEPIGAGGRGSEIIYPRRVIAREEPSGAKVIYCGFGLQTMGRRWGAAGDYTCGPPPTIPPLRCLNYKQKLGHAWVCWMLSASCTGQVKDINDRAVAGALVQLLQGNNVVGSAFTRADGFYTINGLPHGGWSIRVDSPVSGSFQKADVALAHALEQPRVDVRLSPPGPGSISGKVTDQFRNGVPGAKIKATFNAPPSYPGQRDFLTTTDATGFYRLEGLPPSPTSSYTVMVDTPFPAAFNNPQPASRTEFVAANIETPNVDFRMTALPAPLDVFVFESAAGTRGPPIQGAQVELIQNGQPLPGFVGTTDATGLAQFNDVPPGPTTAHVSANVGGVMYRDKFVTFNMPQTQQIEVLLERDLRPRGNVCGTIRAAATGQPLELPRFASIQVVLTQPGEPFRRTTTIQPFNPGPPPRNYEFTDIPNDTYDFTIDDPRFIPQTVTATTAGAKTSGVDFLLRGQPGILSGTVNERLPNGGVGAPIAGATVTISTMAQQSTPVFTTTTSSQGRYTTSPTRLASDVYIVKATAPFFIPNSVSDVFVAGNTQAPPVLLDRVPPVRVSGTIRSQVTPNPLVEDALVELIRESDGVKVLEARSQASITPNPDRNYTFTAVPVGERYIVKVSRSGYRPAQRTIPFHTGPINVGENVDRVDFNLRPEFTFQAGLQMVSPPDDYSGQDAADVFGIPRSVFRAAKFLPLQNRYAIYDEPPANQVIAGRGQFVRFPSDTAFTRAGTPTPADFRIPVDPGWQLIGSGRHGTVAFMDIRVVNSDGTEISMQQAIADGVIFGSLFGWAGSRYVPNEQTLEPFRAYFLKAFAPVSLKIPQVRVTSNGRSFRRYAGVPALFWPLVEAEIQAAGLGPASATGGTVVWRMPGRALAGSSLGLRALIAPPAAGGPFRYGRGDRPSAGWPRSALFDITAWPGSLVNRRDTWRWPDIRS